MSITSLVLTLTLGITGLHSLLSSAHAQGICDTTSTATLGRFPTGATSDSSLRDVRRRLGTMEPFDVMVIGTPDPDVRKGFPRDVVFESLKRDYGTELPTILVTLMMTRYDLEAADAYVHLGFSGELLERALSTPTASVRGRETVFLALSSIERPLSYLPDSLYPDRGRVSMARRAHICALASLVTSPSGAPDHVQESLLRLLLGLAAEAEHGSAPAAAIFQDSLIVAAFREVGGRGF